MIETEIKNKKIIELKDFSLLDTQKGSYLIQNFSLSVKLQEHLGFSGKSGRGKSSIALALLNLLPPTIQFEGKRIFFEPANEWQLGKDMCLVFQDPHKSLSPYLTVKQHLMLIQKGKKLLKGVIEEHFDLFSLPLSLFSHYPHQLSGGEKQRICLMMALLMDPHLLILDEVFSSLDFDVRVDVLKILESFQKKPGKTLIYISHDPLILDRLTDRVVQF